MQTQVLIADSDISFVVKVKQALEQTGRYTVTAFATGQAALEHLAWQRQDVVVIDAVLRDMDGLALLEQLRASRPDLAVIFVSGEIKDAARIGVEAVLAKPYRARDLDLHLQEAIQKKAQAPPPQTVLFGRDDATDLDAYLSHTGDISDRESAAGQAAAGRPAQDLPSAPLDGLSAPAADSSLEDLLETSRPTEEEQSRQALDEYLKLTGDIDPRRLAARQMDAVRREAEDLPPGPLDDLEAPGAEMSLDELDELLGDVSDEWLATLQEGPPLSAGEVDEAGAQAWQATDLDAVEAPGARGEEDSELDFLISLTEDTPTLRPKEPSHAEELQRLADELPPGPLDHLDAPDADLSLEQLMGKLEGEGQESEPTPESLQDLLVDGSFAEILAMMEEEEEAEAVESPPPPRRRAGDTLPLPPLESAPSDGVRDDLHAGEVEDATGTADEDGSDYLQSFQETIAHIASKPPTAPLDAPAEPPTMPDSRPQVAPLAEWELELARYASDEDERSAQMETPDEEVLAEPLEDWELPLWVAELAAEEARESATEADERPSADRDVGEDIALDDLFAPPAPEDRPRLKKLPPRAEQEHPPQEATPPAGEYIPPLGLSERETVPGSSGESEWQPLAEVEPPARELPDWLVDAAADELEHAGPSEVATAIEGEGEPESDIAPLEGAASLADDASAVLPAEPVIVEPTLQRGTAYLTPDIAALEEPEPPPLPSRAPDEWQPAFPAEAAVSPPAEQARPEPLLVHLEGVGEPASASPSAATTSAGRRGHESPPASDAPSPAGARAGSPPPETPEADALIAHTENAQFALQLTHLAVESSAEVLMLTRNRRLVGYAGEVSSRDALDLADAVSKHWDPDGGRRQTQVQFVHMALLGKDYILYSIATTDDMVLSMAFPANTPLGQIRRHAKELAQALEAEEEEAHTADTDRPARVAQPPPAVASVGAGAADAPPPAAEIQDASASPAEPEPRQLATYTCVWALRDARARLDSEQEDSLKGWLGEVAAAHHWRIADVIVRPDYINVLVEAPGADSPAKVVEALMDATSSRLLAAYPDRLVARHGQGLWADGYYVVTPGRALSEREIARFLSYQRREQAAGV